MPKIVERALVIYTDGSLFPVGRKGGYGIVFVHIDEVGNEAIVDQHAPPGVMGTTGNRMELQATVTALEMAPRCACYALVEKVVIRTDSRYVADNYRNALFQWRREKWRNREGRPIENADLWKDFVRCYGKLDRRKEVEWVKGHAKDKYNKAADKLAKESAKSPLSRRVFRSSVRRKTSPNPTKVGSIVAEGQTLIIRVVEVQRMRVQRMWKCRCEVISSKSPYFEAVDFLYSAELMRDGHYYEVQLNNTPANPTIVAVLRELVQVDAV